jgi:hypothetical protein
MLGEVGSQFGLEGTPNLSFPDFPRGGPTMGPMKKVSETERADGAFFIYMAFSL